MQSSLRSLFSTSFVNRKSDIFSIIAIMWPFSCLHTFILAWLPSSSFMTYFSDLFQMMSVPLSSSILNWWKPLYCSVSASFGWWFKYRMPPIDNMAKASNIPFTGIAEWSKAFWIMIRSTSFSGTRADKNSTIPNSIVGRFLW